MEQKFTREDTKHAPGMTNPATCTCSIARRCRPRRTRSTRPASILGQQLCATRRTAVSRPARWRGRWLPAASTASPGSTVTRWSSTCLDRRIARLENEKCGDFVSRHDIRIRPGQRRACPKSIRSRTICASYQLIWEHGSGACDNRLGR